MKSIPMPARIAALPRHTNGYPIPFFVHREKGKPVDLRITSPYAQLDSIKYHKCWVCGQKLGSFTCFIGGPVSMKNGVFSDGPMHRDCAEYALRVCPYLAVSKVERREDGMERTVAPFQIMEKPDKFGLLISKGYQVIRVKDSLFWKANEPYEVVWWKDGTKMPT